MGFIIDAHLREVIARCAVANAGISGSDIRDKMLEAVEMLRENGSPYTAMDTRSFARQFGLKRCFIPVRSPQRAL